MRYLATVAYLGTRYYGFERQKEFPTIQGELEKALAFLCGETTLIHGAGRTDAGVHAKGQTFSFDAPKEIADIPAFIVGFNRLLPSDILIKQMKAVPDSFDARHSAAGKVYSYTFHQGIRDPFALTSFQMEWPHFDEAAFEKALSLFVGRHDFKDFTTKATDKDNFIRTIDAIDVSQKEGQTVVVFRGNGFMTYMVRILMGVAFKVGLGKLSLEEVSSYLVDSQRHIISFKAPAEGLCLEEVIYG